MDVFLFRIFENWQSIYQQRCKSPASVTVGLSEIALDGDQGGVSAGESHNRVNG